MKLNCKALFLILFTPSVSLASDTLPDLDLEALMAMDVQVTSAMKRAQSAFETSASIYVLTGEQITKSGATSVPEALKMVPGLVVRQIDNNQWAISARGIASRYSSKMLVMIDGQSFHTPEFAAVYWESLSVPLYDIARIEVIRGQGGQLWGTNANNGVINIITKNSMDTRGGYADVSSGDKINLDANLRYGGDISNQGSYRAYAHVKDGDEAKKGLKLTPNDYSEQYSFGARLDFTPNDEWSGLFHFDVTESNLGQHNFAVNDESHASMVYSEEMDKTDSRVMARLENRISPAANQMLQVSWLEQHSTQLNSDEKYNSFDADYQMNFLYASWQFDWGLNYRKNAIDIDSAYVLTSDKDYSRLEQYGVFGQAQFELIEDELALIFGVKSEHNDMTGWENQPLVRLMWTPSPEQALWVSASETVRIPSLVEFNDNLTVDGQKVVNLLGSSTGYEAIDNYQISTFINGNDAVKPETSTSYELGYRLSKEKWALDLSLYHTVTKEVAAATFNANIDQFTSIFALLQQDLFEEAFAALTTTEVTYDLLSAGESIAEGGDIALSWQASESLNGEIGYSYNTFDYDMPSGIYPITGNDSVSKQFFGKLDAEIFDDHNLFATIRVENSDAYYTDNYTSLDLAWHWQVRPAWRLSLTGTNLLAGSHLEYGDDATSYTIPSFVEESFTLKVSAEF